MFYPNPAASFRAVFQLLPPPIQPNPTILAQCKMLCLTHGVNRFRLDMIGEPEMANNKLGCGRILNTFHRCGQQQLRKIMAWPLNGGRPTVIVVVAGVERWFRW